MGIHLFNWKALEMKKVTMEDMKNIINEKYFSVLYKNLDIKNVRLVISIEILLFQLWKCHYKDMDEIYNNYTKSVDRLKKELI